MGMYTEVFLRADLIMDVDENTLEVLRCMTDPTYAATALETLVLPDHPLFEHSRWRYLGSQTSYYFPQASDSSLVYCNINKFHSVVIHGNIKNYEGEIDLFFDWIDPFLDHSEGEFIGYSMYEEADNPTLRYKQTPRRKRTYS